MTAAIVVSDVTKTYRAGKQAVEVLHGVNLEVETGEFVSLMGPSGSGKTTLLNLIGGLDRPTTGQVSVAGERLDQLSPGKLSRWRAQHIGFVFQFYNLMPTLSAEQNVVLPLLLTRLGKAERLAHARTALELVGLSDRLRHRPTELSGGQQQRVSIARALVSDPDVLVCDEPTGDLDRASAEQVLELLQILNRDHGKTIVMVTHDPKAAKHAPRQIFLDKGRLVGDLEAAA